MVFKGILLFVIIDALLEFFVSIKINIQRYGRIVEIIHCPDRLLGYSKFRRNYSHLEWIV